MLVSDCNSEAARRCREKKALRIEEAQDNVTENMKLSNRLRSANAALSDENTRLSGRVSILSSSIADLLAKIADVEAKL